MGQPNLDEAIPFGALARRIHARLIMQRAFVEALKVDPSLSQWGLFRALSEDNADMLREEYGA